MGVDTTAQKRAAAEAALAHVAAGMTVGLGTGSTAALFLEALAERVRDGLNVVGVPTSEATRAQAAALGIALTTLDDACQLDLTVDGADELDDRLQLIKGGGGALLREKIVAAASARMIVIADASKRVPVLGRYPLPVEVTPFGHRATQRLVVRLAGQAGCAGEVRLRLAADGRPFVSDEGNFILDCAFGRIERPPQLATALAEIPGVVEHGLFLGLATMAIIGGPEGVQVIEASAGAGTARAGGGTA